MLAKCRLRKYKSRHMMKKISYLLTSLLLSAAAFGSIEMPSIFSDNMMLQRNKPVKFWGKAKPNATVKVEFAGQSKSTTADKSGLWSLNLNPLKASTELRKISIYENGKLDKTINGVLVGEVWFTGGQSNMELSVKNTDNLNDALARGKYPTIRYFNQNAASVSKEPLFDAKKDKYAPYWQMPNGKNIANMNAVAFYFAEALNDDLSVPVGIIKSALGATRMSCWVDKETIGKVESFKIDQKTLDDALKNFDYERDFPIWQKARNEYDQALAKFKKGEGKKPRNSEYLAYMPIPESPFSYRGMPTGCFNAVVAPFAGYTVRGFLWYQGEGDAFGYRVKSFEKAFSSLIDCWRRHWGDKTLPFYFVQLTAHNRSTAQWGDARFAQYLVSQHVKNTNMAVTIDLGMKEEIHPPYKKPIGIRLEKLVLKEVYGVKNLNPYFPKFKSVSADGDDIKITFETYGKKLECKGKPRGFEILVGKKWIKPKKAEFKDNAVVLTDPKACDAKTVRYLWESWCGDDVCIFADDGLPAMPYKMDIDN